MGILLTDAAVPEQSAGAGLIPMLIIYALFGVALYFLFFRPQRKEQKKMNAMLSALEIGDSVLTKGGFYGIIIDISDDTVIIEFGNNKNCRIPTDKAAIIQVEKPTAE